MCIRKSSFCTKMADGVKFKTQLSRPERGIHQAVGQRLGVMKGVFLTTRVDLTLGLPRCITAPHTSIDEWKNRSRHLMRTLTVDWRTVDRETIDRNMVGDTCQRCCCSLLTLHHPQRATRAYSCLQSRLFLIQNQKLDLKQKLPIKNM